MFRADSGPAAVGANGKGLVRLPGSGTPILSPDGSKIAYFVDEWRGDDLYSRLEILDTETGAVARKTGTVRRLAPLADLPLWAPDSSSLIYETAEGDDELLHVVDPSAREIRTFRLRGGGSWSWSPDGASIVVMDEGLHVFSVASGAVRTILEDVGEADYPPWAPAADRIVYSADSALQPDLAYTSLRTIRADGSDDRVVAASHVESDPAWAPKGDRIAYVASNPGALRIVGADGDDNRVVTELDVNEGWSIWELAWSPDGRTIALYGEGLVLVDVETGTKHVLESESPPSEMSVSWSPDGRRLAFEWPTSTFTDVWVVNRDGSGRHRVTQGVLSGADNGAPQWDPLGRPTSQLPTVPGSTGPTSPTVVGPRELKTIAPVRALAADRALVAYVTPQDGCGAPELWRVGSRAVVPVPDTTCVAVGACTARPCQAEGGEMTDEVAIAGTHVLWNHVGREGNTPFANVLTATLARPRPVDLGTWTNAYGLAGKGRLLVFATWDANAELSAVVDGKLRPFPGVGRPASVDANRVALVSGQHVRVTDASGRIRETITVPNIDSVALDGPRLLVLHGSTLDVYVGGRRRARFGSFAAARLRDASAGIAVLTTDRAVTVLDVGSGRRATIAGGLRGPLQAQIESAGLVYSHVVSDRRHPGRITFVPSAEIRRALR